MTTPPINNPGRRRFVRQGAIMAGGAIAAPLRARTTPADTESPLDWTALQLSAAIRDKKLSCVDLMEAYLARLNWLNPGFNAIVSMAEPEALLSQARQRDAELAAGQYSGWMHGFPVAAKDLTDAAGFITSNGSPIFRDNLAAQDSNIVARMKAAGAIITGKTNVPEFGLGSQSYNPLFGATLNAYDGKSTAGGSSGGAAAALALGMLPVADGSDLMGSLRNPAGFNNVIGFRPTPGTVPLSASFIEELPCKGPMARTVSDTARLLSTIAGYYRRSPTSLQQDPARFAKPLARDSKGVRIGWLGNFDGYLAMEPGVLQLCEAALKDFSAIGCAVDEARLDFPMARLWETWLVFRHWLVRGRLGDLYTNPQTRKQLKPEALWEAEGALALSAQDVYLASKARGEYYQALLTAFDNYDYLVLPTAQVFPFDADIHWPKEIDGRAMDTYHRWMEVVIPGTLSGCPVINVPAGFSAKGLPMGLQIIGPRYADFEVLQIAYAYEQQARWNLDRRPPVLARTA